MGRSHPLDPRGLPRHRSVGPGRLEERLGRALLALVVAAPGAAQEPDPAWREQFQAWTEEFRSIRERLEEPASRTDAAREYRAAVDRLARAARELAVPLYHKAYELGSTSEYTPALDDRLRYLELAAAAASLYGQQPAAARAEHERALALFDAGRRVEARDALETVLHRYPGAKIALSYVRATLAELQRQLGDCDRALELCAELERSIATDASLSELAPELERIRDYVHIDLGLPDLAWEGIRARWQRAEARHESGRGSSSERFEAGLAYVHLLCAVDDHEHALEVAEELLADEELVRDPTRAARLLLLAGASENDMARTSLQGAVLKEAGGSGPMGSKGSVRIRRALELGLGENDALFARLELAQAELFEGRLDGAALELEHARAALAEEGAGLAEEGAEEDLPAHEAARLVTLEARLALARGDPPAALRASRARLELALQRLLDAWSRVPQREGGTGYLLYGRRREIVAEYTRLALAIDGDDAGAAAGLEKVLELQARGTLARMEGAPAVELGEIRTVLLEGERGVLVYLPTNARSHVFALDREHLVHGEFGPSDGIDALRRDYLAHVLASREGLRDPAQRTWILAHERELAGALARELLPEPVLELVATWSGVTVVGTDVLGTLPFEWLPLGDERRLGVELALDYLPSLPLGVAWARRPRGNFELDYALVGGAEAHPSLAKRWPELEEIPFPSELEAELTAAFAPGSARVLRGKDASFARLLELDLPSVRILQFLVHGVEEHERERSLALVLTPGPDDDGLLRWEDVARAHAPALVLLTACRTGEGPTRKGDPLVGDMSGAWLAAGAGAAVHSRTNLSLGEARAFSVLFCSRLVEGATPAEALRDVRAELVREHGEEAPFRQGLLQVVGLGHRPVFPARAPRAAPPVGWTLGLGGALATLALGWALGRRCSRRDPAGSRSAGSSAS